MENSDHLDADLFYSPYIMHNNTSSSELRNLIYRKAWDKIPQTCENNPLLAKMVDRLGDLPLHEACLQAAPFHVIKYLVKAHPAGIKAKGFCGRLPLHYASYIKPNPKVIKLLLKKYAKGASIKDSDGRLPVHLAVVRNAPEEVIRILILTFPDSLIIHNNFGNTPQMLAQSNTARSIFKNNSMRDVCTAPGRSAARTKKLENSEKDFVKKMSVDTSIIGNPKIHLIESSKSTDSCRY